MKPSNKLVRLRVEHFPLLVQFPRLLVHAAQGQGLGIGSFEGGASTLEAFPMVLVRPGNLQEGRLT